MAVARVLTRDLDSRLKAVEERLEDIVGHLSLLDEQMRRAALHTQPMGEHGGTIPLNHSGNGDGAHAEIEAGKLAELEASVARLDQRVEKIASTIITQTTARWT